MTPARNAFWILPVALVASACATPPENTQQQAQSIVVCAAGPTIRGIDVSSWDGTVDWSMVAASGIRFTYIRVSDGLDYPDDQFAANWAHARAAGVIRGAYQYFRPNQDPVAQANYLLAQMGTLEANDLPPVIDIEMSGGATQAQVTAAIHQWVDRIQSVTGRAPIFYAGLYSWPALSGSNDFAAYRLWVPQYGPTCPNLPAPWTNWTIFQNADNGTVPGVGMGTVDMDIFNGTFTDLLSVAGERIVCGDGMCTAGETHDSCPADCVGCASVPAMGRIVDESEPCFEGGGDPTYLRHVTTAGWESTLIWTHTTAAASPSNYGLWNLTFDQAGSYRIEAYTAAPWAQSTRAQYLVRHAGAMDSATVNQSLIDGWTIIGDYEFAAGGDQSVRLNDNTGEPSADNVQLVFDALRITRLDGPLPIPDGGVADGSEGDASDDAERGGDAASPGDTGSDVNHDARVGEGGTTGGHVDGGCSCNAAGRGGAPTALGLGSALAGLAWSVGRRRRRRVRRDRSFGARLMRTR